MLALHATSLHVETEWKELKFVMYCNNIVLGISIGMTFYCANYTISTDIYMIFVVIAHLQRST